jgi:hypothetical protein
MNLRLLLQPILIYHLKFFTDKAIEVKKEELPFPEALLQFYNTT